MTQAIERDPIYRCRRFQTETIELCVRWYITYRLSYRDLVAMMAERGVVVSHTTIMRWVLRYVPEFEKRWTRYARRVNSSWRVDETAVPVRGGRPISGGRQTRRVRGLSFACGSRHGRCAGLLQEGCGQRRRAAGAAQRRGKGDCGTRCAVIPRGGERAQASLCATRATVSSRTVVPSPYLGTSDWGRTLEKARARTDHTDDECHAHRFIAMDRAPCTRPRSRLARDPDGYRVEFH